MRASAADSGLRGAGFVLTGGVLRRAGDLAAGLIRALTTIFSGFLPGEAIAGFFSTAIILSLPSPGGVLLQDGTTSFESATTADGVMTGAIASFFGTTIILSASSPSSVFLQEGSTASFESATTMGGVMAETSGASLQIVLA